MKEFMKFSLLIGGLLVPLCVYYVFVRKPKAVTMPKIQTVEEVKQLFPATKLEIEQRAAAAMAEAEKELTSIYAIDKAQRTFENTMAAFDRTLGRLKIVSSLIHLLTLVSPDEEVRTAAQETIVKVQAFLIDHFSLNPRLYKACEEYEARRSDPAFVAQERLNDEQKYFVSETMLDFRRSGLQLPAATQEKVKELRKALSQLELEFELNISAELRGLEVTKEELDGWDEAALKTLKKSESGKYILGMDYPTYNRLFEECKVIATRKAYYDLFMQRAYPKNEQVLAKVIELRDQLAHLLGYPSFAHLDIDNEMAKTPATVTQFINEVEQRAQIKLAQEIEELKKDLPEGVELAKDGKFYPWDYTYVKNYYKKKYLAVDEAYISQYFPIEHTLPALLSIYQQFFGLTFKKIEGQTLWHPDTELLAVYKDGAYRGTVILDIHPRPFKYTHAAEVTVVPALRTQDGSWHPAVVTVLANFPAPTPDQPALLKRQDMITFFHEFGHAIHALLGATELASFSGTNVKTDFVEMPSQMLEEWMWDPVILKRVSSHYKTKEPLSDELIEKIRALKSFDTGHHLTTQLALAACSLAYFMPGAHKDIEALWKDNQIRFRTGLVFEPSNRAYAAFGHLANYSSKYYSYLWSLVYACDLFAYIKQFGLLNPTIGERYIRDVIGKGGGKEPMELISNFIGRKPTSDAFFKDLGL